MMRPMAKVEAVAAAVVAAAVVVVVAPAQTVRVAATWMVWRRTISMAMLMVIWKATTTATKPVRRARHLPLRVRVSRSSTSMTTLPRRPPAPDPSPTLRHR